MIQGNSEGKGKQRASDGIILQGTFSAIRRELKTQDVSVKKSTGSILSDSCTTKPTVAGSPDVFGA